MDISIDGSVQSDKPLLVSLPFLPALLDGLSSQIAIIDRAGTIVAVNQAWRNFAAANGYEAHDHGVGANYLAACEEGKVACEEGRAAAQGIRAALAEELPTFVMEYPCHSPDEKRWFLMRVTRFTAHGAAYVVAEHLNITAQKLADEARRAQALIAGEKQALELIAQGATLNEVLEFLTLTIEQISDGEFLSSVLLLDRDGVHLRHGAAPNLPPSYSAAIDGVAIGPRVGSCGTAAFLKERVIVSDIASDPLWEDYRELALSHGLQACWSTPICAPEGHVLGTFAIYYRRPHRPSPQDLQLIDLVSNTASIMIQRKRAEETQVFLASIVESSDDAIIGKTVDGQIRSWNRGAERLYGYTAQEAIGQSISMLIPAERHEDLTWITERLMRGEVTDHYETVRVSKDGRRVDVSLTISPLRDESGRVVGASVIARDITAHKRAEEEKGKFVFLAEHSSEFIGMCDMQYRPFFVNPAGLRLVGLDSLEAAQRVPVEEFFFPEDRAFLYADFFPHVLREGHGEMEIRFRHFQTGEALWMVYNVLVLRNASGEPTGLATISQNVTDRRRAEELLRQADRRKDEFLAMLAHELRNPLAPIRNSVEILSLRESDPAAVKQAREVIDRQVRQMIRLVDDLLDVSRITRNKIDLKKEPFDLADIIAAAIETSRPLIESRHHRLTLNLCDRPLFLEADFARLAQVLTNLLNNAAKYTEVGGHITVTAERADGDLLVRVRDTGVGIAPDVLPSIFDLFTQEERSLDRAQGGLGVGLTLVRQLAEMHGGAVEATSAGFEQGSEFTVRLPALPMPFLEAPVASASVDAQPVAAGRRRILVVDDNADSAESMALLLGFWGHEVLIAHDGLTGIEKAQTYRPDVVLLDIGLPKLDGYGVAQRLRQQASLEKTMLIAMTGYGQEEDRRRTYEAGFHHHLVKPVDIDELEGLLTSPASSAV